MTEKLLAVIFVFIHSVISGTGYGGIVLLMAIESACIPLPSELIMPFAAYLVFTGTFKLLWVATAGAIGCNLGSLVAYEIGVFCGGAPGGGGGGGGCFGEKEGGGAAAVSWDVVVCSVFFCWFLCFVIRSFCGLPAGVARMPRGRFHLYTFLGSWPWCLGLAYLGMKLGENWRELGKYFHKFDAAIGVVLVAGMAWFVWSHWKHRISSQPSAVGRQ